MTQSKNDFDLDDLFDQARDAGPEISDTLMARVLADADVAMQPVDDFAIAAPQGFWSRLWSGLGGWPAIGGFATACAAGVWIGLNPPLAVTDVAYGYIDGSTDSALVDYETAFLSEEDL